MNEEIFEFNVVTVDSHGQIIQRTRQQNKCIKEDLGEGVSLEMASIPGGTFLMGSPEDEEGTEPQEQPRHQVKIVPFYLGKYPINQAQWQLVASYPKVKYDLPPNPSEFKGLNRPVDSISYLDALEFCYRLSQKTGKPYRLPTEAEWEYACRAGATTPFHFGQTITTNLANYDGSFTYGAAPQGNKCEHTTEVAYFQVANTFGLYDMHGNVGEWCQSKYLPYPGGAEFINNQNDYWLDFKNCRVLRGGTWMGSATGCRSAARGCAEMEYRFSWVGMRVACS
ncbi:MULTISPECIES: formylglycine-generating enzyme family protein [unclassified Coleofasciculus]|uniref:formylglycine-generating enzyme family protein n=1 Tax=unclassified Coleofasciculus TaxID=2692782 RepID=UPI00187E79C3|nr:MULTISPECIES: formylglycine-generating enzyme family protein [unclassified Coleofasciculus]MBE9126180.1 formylglycine-generating enzyme family protein [Coleofasciculus sp. LEGE 07081]MBE9149613.1 formylglycine-generating enzyme family protein [Coleofasciculus sp. LEGE 07092]